MRSSETLAKLKRVAKRALERFGVFQTHVVLNVLYVLVGAPVTAISKLLGRDPSMPDAEEGSYWRERDEKAQGLDDFTRQH